MPAPFQVLLVEDNAAYSAFVNDALAASEAGFRITAADSLHRALDLLLTGRQIDAAEALRIGLVERVTAPGSLDDEVHALASTLAAKPPLAVRSILDAVRRGAEMPAAGANALEASLFGMLGTTTDMREGTRAFLDKRIPTFKGE